MSIFQYLSGLLRKKYYVRIMTITCKTDSGPQSAAAKAQAQNLARQQETPPDDRPPEDRPPETNPPEDKTRRIFDPVRGEWLDQGLKT